MPSEVVYKPSEKINPIYAGGTITPPKFMPTYYEWLFKNAEIISRGGQGNTNSNLDIYTVPEDSILFITSAFMSLTGLVVDNRCNLNIKGKSGFLGLAVKKDLTGATSLNFNPPIRVNSTDIIQWENNTANIVFFRVGFTGFLVKHKNIPNF